MGGKSGESGKSGQRWKCANGCHASQSRSFEHYLSHHLFKKKAPSRLNTFMISIHIAVFYKLLDGLISLNLKQHFRLDLMAKIA